jgi:hypothetical protein
LTKVTGTKRVDSAARTPGRRASFGAAAVGHRLGQVHTATSLRIAR